MGVLSLAFLAALALNGAAMRPLIRRVGRHRYAMHVLLSLGFIATMALHAYRLGTDLSPLR